MATGVKTVIVDTPGDFQVADWIVQPKLNSFRRNGQTVRVEPKVMQVLLCLATEGDVVSKEKLLQRVWPDTFVTDDVLTRSISELRKIFADNPKDPQFIQTIPKGGYRLIAPVSDVLPATPAAPTISTAPAPTFEPPARERHLLPIGLTLLLALLLLSYAIGRYNGSAFRSRGRAMLAVLPFQNLSNDPDQLYFADGLTAEMISQFGHLPSDRLGVIDWNSMSRYRGTTKDEDQIGKELGANYLLEGTVRRSGNQVRITAELIEAGHHAHLWSNSYDGTLEDVIKLQSRVAREIASEIRVQLGPQDWQRLSSSPVVNGEGYDDYLKAKFDPKEMAPVSDDKMDHLQQAIRLNPGYVPAYVMIAISYRAMASEGYADPDASYQAGRSALEKALQIDSQSPDAHRELAWIKWRHDWDFSGADAEFRKAIELDPNGSQGHATYGLYLKSMGRNQEALAQIERALQLSPLDTYSHSNAGSQLALMHDFPKAEEQFNSAIQIDPMAPYIYERMGPALLLEGKNDQAIAALEKARDYSNGKEDILGWLGYAYGVSGRKSDARNILNEMGLLAAQHRYVSPLHIALVYSGIGESDLALDWLEKAYKARDEYLVYLHIYPEFQKLHSEPRFQDLERRMKLGL